MGNVYRVVVAYIGCNTHVCIDVFHAMFLSFVEQHNRPGSIQSLVAWFDCEIISDMFSAIL